jgi:hypothetical protein
VGEELVMTRPESAGKPFGISKWEVWEAYRKVKGNQGAPGVDGTTLAAFEKDLAGNLYKIWNRMSSGSYFPPPVKAVEIPKPHGGGTRTLGVPTVADRIAQTVVARHLEAKVEPVFHPDSFGYRPRRSALPGSPGESHPQAPTDPDVNLSVYPARAAQGVRSCIAVPSARTGPVSVVGRLVAMLALGVRCV